jgi:nucleotide-binding universal stress UspA family protein
MYLNIPVPLDGSEQSERALHFAQMIALLGAAHDSSSLRRTGPRLPFEP